MSNCNDCKDVEKIAVYLQSGTLLRTRRELMREALVNNLKFTEKQSERVLKFATDLGECLIFEGSREDAIKVIEKLVPHGLKCEARPRRLLK